MENIHNLITNLDFVFTTNGDPALASDYYETVDAFIKDVLNHEDNEFFEPLTEGENYETSATKVVLHGEPLPKRVWTNGSTIIARLYEDFN